MKSFNRTCNRYATPLLCCVASAVIMASLLYYVVTSFLTVTEGYTGASEFVLYHMKGCPHCVTMLPEWDKFESNNNSGIKTRKVEQADAQDEVKKHGISGFPSLLLLDSNGDKIKDYSGPRTASGFAAFCKQNSS